MKRGFTLIELIVVIIIVGILAALGINQYSKVVEKGRGAEARMIIGQIRKLAYSYRLENGTVTGITFADVNIGTASDQIPYPCRSSHYFRYTITGADPSVDILATRCTVDGKSPQGITASNLELISNFSTGTDTWSSTGGY